MISVLVVDDDPIVRSSLVLMLQGGAGLRVAGESGDGRAALLAVAELRPDVVLMDIRMPELDGLAATRRLTSLPRRPKIIVLTTFAADDLVLDALAAGADGYLLKDTPPDGITDAVLKVAAGESILSSAAVEVVLRRVRSATGERDAARQRLARLTEREHDVATAVARGGSNADIAAELYLSVATVKTHVSRLMEKLEVDNRVQIALLVRDGGDARA